MAYQRSGDRTKLMLAESLRNLMKKKTLDKIKIHEIVDACGVNRQTFYYHFQDIYALIEWMYQYDAKQLVEKGSNELLTDGVAIEDVWNGVVVDLFAYVENHRNEILCVLNSKASIYFGNFVYDGLKETLRYVVDERAKFYNIDEHFKNFIANFYATALCGVVQDWIGTNGAVRMSSRELIDMIRLTITGNIEAALQRASEERK